MAEIRINRLRKAFNTFEVVHGIDIHIQDGEFCVFVGPSGCGKSTVLRMVAGLESVTSGEIVLGDRVINDLPPKDRDIAMVFQNYALYPHLSVADNIGFPLRMRGIDRTIIRKEVERVAEIIGLRDLLERHPRQLSGGQRQRVAMGRAIVRDPQAFLFDEPLSNLDAQLRVEMRTQIRELHQRIRTTTIYVTHDQVEAMTMADRIVVLKDGRVEQSGSPLEIYDRPANPFVARFIGSPSMNLFTGRLGEQGLVLKDGAVLPLVRPFGSHDEAVYGVRPEHLDIVEVGTPGSLEAVVAVVEPTGAETMIFARRDGQEITATFRTRPTVKAGERIALKPDTSAVHLFSGDARLN
ncbi:MAG: sn-glycerol-3-phosphate ABC transporter ATP-binding protein UgpC [Rhizobiaceae bacterium]|nr:sn-glycerol-3-phosphate ABC transporter ATP-binding protein UgpC [Rhizobiaceae bacterium]